ncbi:MULTISPECIES: glycine zipper 2TM domain-containing protein [Sphingomonas]|jgi:hypothetical protein|uniref:glycine zipper 2TM domain-containing protein n=1 Tax=Sphingomonas TaxID=13687 RepID=UPI00082C4F35|nr:MULTISPECIES: glycine zipper 2TM domain-containing protein [Sphingomonas]MBY0303151.1 glycine zipper 2TM domain-containing protein [Sphingomonas ginsenosidimutans]
MWKKLTLGMTALAMGTAAMVPAAAQAQRYGDGYGYGRDYYDDGYGEHDRAYDRAYRDGWNRAPRYYETRGDYRNRYRYNRACQSGTTGTIVGAIAGGLLGRAIDTRGDRTLGTVLGAGAGALAGNAVERADNPRFCQR